MIFLARGSDTMFVRSIFLIALLPMLSGCAAGFSSSGGTGPDLGRDEKQMEQLAQKLETDQEHLVDDLRLSAKPDCHKAQDLLKTICELSRRICLISDRHPQEKSMRQTCEDSRQRCEKSRIKVSIRCGMAP